MRGLSVLANTASWLFVITTEPYQHGLDSDPAVDLVMAAGAFGQQVSVLFMGEGSAYLDTKISPAEGESDLRKLLKSLPLYDVDDVFVLADTADNTPATLSISAERITANRTSQLIADADHVVSF